MTRFYLGTHNPAWLATAEVPLFVSHRRLAGRRRLPRSRTPWALDSGGFTELSMHGRWETTPAAYVAGVRRYRDEIGDLEWAAPQDWMCEPFMLTKTGLAVQQHQERTVANYLELRALAPDLPFVPVLQGWRLADYHRCVDLYERSGVDLAAAAVVGLGSVCRRQSTGEIEVIVESLARLGLRLHGFGVKTAGLARYGEFLTSADSLAWSYEARRSEPLPGHQHLNCANCLPYALRWRERVLRRLRQTQMHLPWGGPIAGACDVGSAAAPPTGTVGGASRRWSGWVDDGRGAMHVQAGRPPTPADREALFAIRDAVVAEITFAERAMGRWEDDGGPPPPDDLRRLTDLFGRLARGLGRA